MTDIDYFSIEGAPGRYFNCPNGLGVLSETACGDSYRLSWQPESIAVGRRFSCRNCQVGKLHSGELVGNGSRFFGKVFCCRCERRSNRLIRGSICVSCYNREREFKIGKNARGTAPVNVRPVFPESVLVAYKDTVLIRKFDTVTGTKEAVLTFARMHDEKLYFGWCATAVIVR